VFTTGRQIAAALVANRFRTRRCLRSGDFRLWLLPS
jgi:hypothetical protein